MSTLRTVRRRGSPPSRTDTGAPLHDRSARASMTLDAVLAVTGLGGGIYMATHPQTMMPLEFLEGSPFESWLLPGVALIVVNGIWPACALLLTWRRHRLAPLAQCAVGASLLGWLMIQIPLVGYATMFQVPYTALALGLIALNVRRVKTW